MRHPGAVRVTLYVSDHARRVFGDELGLGRPALLREIRSWATEKLLAEIEDRLALHACDRAGCHDYDHSQEHEHDA